MTQSCPARQPRLCGATRPEDSNNPRPCARTEHRGGQHIDRQGVAWPERAEAR
ncbi:hypothetical protein [Streptomyces lunalinharesii]|uniref:Uncharacterized protein n=1 Tax=Streptomyces lunalinharesii TaxID=333384 RepID=A0ABP6FB64_9ACTN